jgi:hypothetical protein
MPGLIDPADRPDPAERFRADLAGYLCERSGPELATPLQRLPDQVKADLIMELAERGPSWLRLPPTWPGHPDQEFTRRRSLREVMADRRTARAARRTGPHPAARSRTGWPPARTAACRPPTRAGSGGWARRCAATPQDGTSRRSGRRRTRSLAARPNRGCRQGWWDWWDWWPRDDR